jgi:hypothetical protein
VSPVPNNTEVGTVGHRNVQIMHQCWYTAF